MKTMYLRIVFWLVTGAFCSSAVADPPTPTPVREADAVCARCHQEIVRSYLGTPMANASGVATGRLIAGSFTHVASGVEFQISAENGSAWLSYQRKDDPAVSGRERLQYFLGSGHLGLTYLYTKNGYLLESPVAYYPDLKAYSMKPGLENLRRLPGALPVDSSCLRCHMSGVQRSQAGTENRYTGLPFLHSGVTCESCHGGTAPHVASGGSAPVVNPVKLEPAKRDSTCIVCHLEGATNVERAGRHALEYKPGEDISDYLSYFDYTGGNTTERGVSEVEQFTLSKCKRVTGAAMSCMNCHDPHRSPQADERASYYRAKCLACHTQPRYAMTHYSANPDCTSCHMPKTGAKNIPHVAWTDHRILQRQTENDPVISDVAGNAELRAILPEGGSPRDLALAYYDVAVKGKISEKPRATAMLTEAAQSAPDDVAVLNALGVLLEWDGDSARAQDLYRAVLKRDPYSLTGNTNLGTLLAKSGNLEAAASLWRPAFVRNEDVLVLGENLATIECLLGQKDRAVDVLKRVLIYSQDSPQIRNKLKSIEAGDQQCSTGLPKPSLQDP